MKNKYETPTINVDELVKTDVLCSSGDTKSIDNKFVQSQGLLEYVFSGEWVQED